MSGAKLWFGTYGTGNGSSDKFPLAWYCGCGATGVYPYWATAEQVRAGGAEHQRLNHSSPSRPVGGPS